MRDLLSELNEEQRNAAACIEGPVMIIAGAGSGKTRTLTYRIAHLIEEGVDPFNILALTFTNKAASEMKERIVALVGKDAKNIWMGTFHSIFAKVLRFEAEKLGYISSFTIYDTDDSKSAIKQIIKSLNLDPKAYNVGYVLGRISMAKSNLISCEEYATNAEIQQSDQAARKPMIGEIYKLYNQRLRNSMAMDFDDLLYNMNVLLRDYPDVLLKYQERFKHILVDEYQDTNFSQYLIIKKMAARYQNICVVGDDAQSIYAFRGANIQNILNFKRDYPDVRLFKLEQNYRSTQNIVNAANSIISNNRDQIKKEIWTANDVGNRIRLLNGADEREEGYIVAKAITDTKEQENADYDSFAILYRTNMQSRAIEEALRKMKIPYRIFGGLSFYRRKEIKDVLAYLRLVINNYDDEALLRVINYPARGIGQTTLDRIKVAASDNDIAIWTVIENLPSFGLGINTGTANKINDFMMMIKSASSQLNVLNAYDLAKQIIMQSGIIRFLKEDEDPDNANRIENIEELMNGIQEFCEKEDLITPDGEEGQEVSQIKTLDLFLQQVLLLTDEENDKEDTNKVSLMTIHAAKGLEFPYVYVVGMEENLFPSALSISSRQELEEERRLFYVAVTRAEKMLTLSYANTRYQYGNASFQELSRFVDEIEDRYIDIPLKKNLMPKVGDLPKPMFAKRKTIEKKTLKRVQHGPSAGNSPAEINAIQVGMRVLHEKFGYGTVKHIEGENNDRKAVVFFDNTGEKQLLLRFAKLSIVQ
ncbi:MAG: UvrD-helicase domain-containing protein [Bacteroidales bacterium]|nr:UvrD-helicase domain-containing protein [Bacteroidales bacterium]